MERFTRDFEIEMESTEDGKNALRRHFARVDKGRWAIVKATAVIAFFIVAVLWTITLL